MGGRSRREQTFHYWKEDQVVKPLPPEKFNDNKVSALVLYDTTVYYADGKRLAPALFMELEGPFVVRGRLEVSSATGRLKMDFAQDPYIEIPQSPEKAIGLNFSPGTFTPLIWLTGSGGWYEIRPSNQYEALHACMLEAVRFWYSILDTYTSHPQKSLDVSRKRKSLSPPTVQEAFYQFAISDGFRADFVDEVTHLCHQWARFLIPHFLRKPSVEQDQIEWKKNPFAKWLMAQHADISRQAMGRMAAIEAGNAVVSKPGPPLQFDAIYDEPSEKRFFITKAKGKAKAQRTTASPDVDVIDSPTQSLTSASGNNQPQGQARKRRSRPSTRTDEASSPGVQMIDSPTVTPFPVSRARPASTPSGAATAFAPLFPPPFNAPSASPAAHEFGSRPGPSTAGPAASQSFDDKMLHLLVECVESLGTEYPRVIQSNPKALHTKMYQKYKVTHAMYKDEMPKKVMAHYAKRLLPHLSPRWQGSAQVEWLEEEAKMTPKALGFSSEELLVMLTRRNYKGIRSGSSMPSTAPGQTHGKHPTPRTAGKVAALRLAMNSSRKRLVSEMENDDDEGGSSRRHRKSSKRNRVAPDGPYDFDDGGAADQETRHDGTLQLKNDYSLDSQLLVSPPMDAIRIVVHAEKAPSMSPSGLHGTWTCDHEGCAYVVRAADEEDGQARIAKHFETHEQQQARINLAMQEGQRGQNPINHLLERLQAMGRDTTAAPAKDGFPPPIKRRLRLV